MVLLEKDLLRLLMFAARDEHGWGRMCMDMAGGFEDLEEFKLFEDLVRPFCEEELSKEPFLILVPGDDMHADPDTIKGILDGLADFIADCNRKMYRLRFDEIEERNLRVEKIDE